MNLPHVAAFERSLDDLARTFGLSPPSPSTPPPAPHPWTALGISRREWRNRRAENLCPKHGIALRLKGGSNLAVCPVAACGQKKRVSL